MFLHQRFVNCGAAVVGRSLAVKQVPRKMKRGSKNMHVGWVAKDGVAAVYDRVEVICSDAEQSVDRVQRYPRDHLAWPRTLGQHQP
jgi:hypothetical protein